MKISVMFNGLPLYENDLANVWSLNLSTTMDNDGVKVMLKSTSRDAFPAGFLPTPVAMIATNHVKLVQLTAGESFTCAMCGRGDLKATHNARVPRHAPPTNTRGAVFVAGDGGPGRTWCAHSNSQWGKRSPPNG